jgi:GNAT superfamily N-acetyltransferase
MDWAPSQTATEIRRARCVDPAALGEFFTGLSVQTRYLRFFAPITPNPAMLRYLCGTGPGNVDAVIAIRGGAIIGHAMGADRAGPTGDRMTDIGVVVADAWQGHGVGSALVRTLISRAQARGAAFLTMDVLHGNNHVLAMITSHWPTARTAHSPDGVTVHVRLPRRTWQQPRVRPGRPLTATARPAHPYLPGSPRL